jgi:RNA polymerase sigma factor (sigma-70 family)
VTDHDERRGEERHSDADLVRAAVMGSRAARRCLVTELTPTVSMVVARYIGAWRQLTGVGNAGVARAELVQEVMAELFDKDCLALRRYDPGRARLRTYVARVASNTCQSLLCRRRPRLNHGLIIPSPDAQSIENRIDARFLLERLRVQFMSRLNPFDALLFQELFLNGRTVEQLASSTGLTRGALHTRKCRLRKRAAHALRFSASGFGVPASSLNRIHST